MGYNSEYHIQLQDELMNYASQVEEGELSHLDALIKMRENKEELEKSLEIIKAFETQYINEIASKASEYPNGYCGYKVEMVNGRKMYSFKHIEEWQAAENAKKQIEDKYKAMFEARMKGLKGANIDIETGEELTMPEINYGASFLKVTKAKQFA